MIRCRGKGDALTDVLSSLSLAFYATAKPLNALMSTVACRLPAKLVKQWFGFFVSLSIPPWECAVCRLTRQTRFVFFFSSWMSVNLPSCHRAAFPPLFAQLIPFPYKECERQEGSANNERKDETTAFLPLYRGYAAEICHRDINFPLKNIPMPFRRTVTCHTFWILCICRLVQFAQEHP